MSSTQQFSMGLACLKRGFGIFLKHPHLVWYAIIPTLISLIVMALMIGTFIGLFDNIYSWLASIMGHIDITNPTGVLWHIVDGILWVIDLAFRALIIALSLIAIFLIGFFISLIFSAPFNDVLSEKVEEIETGINIPDFKFGIFISNIIRIIKVELYKTAFFLIVPLALIPLNIIPILGNFLYALLTFGFGIWSLGFIYIDYPMSRRFLGFGARLKFAWRNKWSLVGLGWVFVIPLFNLIFTAPLTAAGTVLYFRLNAQVMSLNTIQANHKIF